MIILLIFLFSIALSQSTLNLIKLQPKFEFHDRRSSFLIICNATGVTDNLLMFFHFNGKNHTVPRMNNDPGVYIGNFSAFSTDQSRVMIICINLNTGAMISSKVYLLGYPPSVISQHYQVHLNCRDFNLYRVVCCVSPNVSAIEQLLGFSDNMSGLFHAKLYYSDSESNELTVNKSCYSLTEYVLAPTISLDLVINNVLGNVTYNFTFDRTSIQKPNEPQIFIEKKTATNFSFYVDLHDTGEYLVFVNCTSSSPIIEHKKSSFKVFGVKSEYILVGEWSQNSEIYCTFKAKVLFGNDPVGDFSDSSSVFLKLLEGKPSKGPTLFSSLLSYSSITDGILTNVVIYFMNLDLIYKNGIITKYQWICDHCFIRKTNVSRIAQDITSSSRSFILESALEGSHIFMTACTAKGCSDSWTNISLQKLRDGVPNRGLSVIKNTRNPSNLTFIWKEETENRTQLLLLACSRSSIESDCSSIEKVSWGKYVDGLAHLQIDTSLHWKFALVSLHGNNNYKLKWISCFYNSPSVYEMEKKLNSFSHQSYVKFIMDCNLNECSIHANIRVPNCEIFPDVFFYKLKAVYETNNGEKEIAIEIHSTDQVNFTLSDMSPGYRKYKINIHVNTMFNNSISWFETTVKTNFWCRMYLSLLVALVIVIIGLIVFIIWRKRRCIRKKYFEKRFIEKNPNLITTNNSITPFDLLNTDKKEYVPAIDPIHYKNDSYSVSSKGKESTLSTSVDSSDTNGTLDENILFGIDSGGSKSYTERPGNDIGRYSHIGCPSNKIDHSNIVNV